MSAETLRLAASLMREEWGEPRGSAWERVQAFHLAVADWLDAEAHNADAGIGGRGFFSVGGQSDALTVAKAYLGESS